MTVALEGGEWSVARPGRTLPPRKTWYPLYRRLGGPQGRSGQAENLVPTRIRSRTVQPVVSRYTDWAAELPGPRPCQWHNIISRGLEFLATSLQEHQMFNTLWYSVWKLLWSSLHYKLLNTVIIFLGFIFIHSYLFSPSIRSLQIWKQS